MSSGTTAAAEQLSTLTSSGVFGRDPNDLTNARGRLANDRPHMDHHVAYGLGVTFAQLGELTEARRWLTRAAAEGFPCYPWYDRDPLMQPLKSDPAFQEFMKQLSSRFDANRARFGG